MQALSFSGLRPKRSVRLHLASPHGTPKLGVGHQVIRGEVRMAPHPLRPGLAAQLLQREERRAALTCHLAQVCRRSCQRKALIPARASAVYQALVLTCVIGLRKAEHVRRMLAELFAHPQHGPCSDATRMRER